MIAWRWWISNRVLYLFVYLLGALGIAWSFLGWYCVVWCFTGLVMGGGVLVSCLGNIVR